MKQLIVETPLNSLSLGNVGVNILREIYSRGIEIGLFPIGETDLSSYVLDKPFIDWLQKSINRRYEFLKKDSICIRNWHIAGSDLLRTNNQVLISYHETSKATPVEVAIVNLQKKTLFCGGYSDEVFHSAGCDNVGSFELGFSPEFHVTGKKYLSSTHWGLCQKWENRKLTGKIISLWVKKYGNNKDHSLTLLVNNPFFSPEDNQRLLSQALENKRYFNVNILPRLSTQNELNEYHNAIDIDLGGISPSESWNIPPFTSTALGKWSIVTASMGNLGWANEENSIMIQPCGMRPSHDGVFFKEGGDYSQGEFYDVSDEEILKSMERAEQKIGQPNTAGLMLQKTHSWKNSLDHILEQVYN